ncbi:GNAT family N-acetyltransferase [Gorillibacterium sp. sgz5001074]|uniref:GNAT family N-acetyltransferase n=1 Tax=Gorillibacterium sp. sgz5001074 TaxID=3446695 RepID=UPI003F664EA7
MRTIRLDTEPGGLRIARASEEELPAVLELWLEAADWIWSKGILQWRPGSFTMETVREHHARTELYTAWGDGGNGELAGTFSLQWSDPFIWQERNDAEQAGYIHRLAVARGWKGRRIGERLLACAEDFIREAGRSRARLDCMADNARLNRFYREAGYVYQARMDRQHWSASLFEKIL